MFINLRSAVRFALTTFLLALSASVCSYAETIEVPTRGQYAKIDVRTLNETIRILKSGTDEQKQKKIGEIKAFPENYAPPVFYLLSDVLFQQGEKDDAAFWFYAGQLRARFDANRCADVSARDAVAVLNQEFGLPINQYMFHDIAKLEALIPKVVEWDRKTPHSYDPHWINLHGMDAMITGLEGEKGRQREGNLSLPKEQWEQIAENTRADYLDGFHQAVAQAKKLTGGK